MQNSLWRKEITIIIIVLFVGASVIPSTGMVGNNSSSTNGGDTLYDDFDEPGRKSHQGEIHNLIYSIAWDVKLTLTETGGRLDYVVFGEAPDANDGPPVDDYDQPKPPAPMPPYVRAWFDDGLPIPYNQMTKDYREYNNSDCKGWNLSIQWMPTDSSETDINITWDPNELNDYEYDNIILYDYENNIEVDMKLNSFYEFTCASFIKHDFKINCSLIFNQPPNEPTINGPSYGKPGVPYNFCIEATDPDGDNIYCIWDWGDGTYTDWLGPYASGEIICASHGWIETGIYEIRVKVKDEYGLETGWSDPFIIVIEDELPYVKIVTPDKRTFYLNFKDRIVLKIPCLTTIIIGKIDIEVDTSDEISGICKVEFYIDDELKYNISAESYNWTWDERAFFRHKITVTAYDRAGNYDSAEIKVRKFF